MRFDLTVPLARYAAEHLNELSFPFRRYHIAKVYRGESPQKGRFREFYQCDIDVVGKNQLSIRYDAEIPCIIYGIFKELNFGGFTIRVNNRKILNGIMEALGVGSAADILRIIDKAEKISKEDFAAALRQAGLADKQLKIITEFIAISGKPDEVIARLKGLNIHNALFTSGIEELETVWTLIRAAGIDENCFAIDLSISRGLDYYTGTVYETVLNDCPRLGSVCSGGRYENLASYYTDEKLPGVGISIGLTRLFDRLKDAGLISFPRKTQADAVIVPLSAENITAALSIAALIRESGFSADVLLEEMPVKKKFQYVSKKDAFFTVVIGSEEEASGSVNLQYKTGKAVEKLRLPVRELAGAMKKISADSQS